MTVTLHIYISYQKSLHFGAVGYTNHQRAYCNVFYRIGRKDDEPSRALSRGYYESTRIIVSRGLPIGLIK